MPSAHGWRSSNRKGSAGRLCSSSISVARGPSPAITGHFTVVLAVVPKGIVISTTATDAHGNTWELARIQLKCSHRCPDAVFKLVGCPLSTAGDFVQQRPRQTTVIGGTNGNSPNSELAILNGPRGSVSRTVQGPSQSRSTEAGTFRTGDSHNHPSLSKTE